MIIKEHEFRGQQSELFGMNAIHKQFEENLVITNPNCLNAATLFQYKVAEKKIELLMIIKEHEFRGQQSELFGMNAIHKQFEERQLLFFILFLNMVNPPEYSLENLKAEYEKAESKWKKESILLLMKLQGFDEKEADILKFDNAFASKNAGELATLMETLHYSAPTNGIKERLKAIVDIIFDGKNDEFVRDFLSAINLSLFFKILESQFEWKTNPEKIFYFFYLVSKHNRQKFGDIITEFLTVFKHFKNAFKPSLENSLKLYMFLFYVYDIPAIREVMPQNPELYRGMINASILATLNPKLFTKEILSPFGLPFLKLPSEQLHLGLSCLALKFNSLLSPTFDETQILKLFETFIQNNNDDKDVIISALLYGLSIWKNMLGDNLLLLLPANVYNMQIKKFQNFNGFPLKFDVDLIHRGIGKKNSDCQQLINSLKITILLLKKHSKIIAHAKFFHDYMGIEHSSIWNYLLTCLLLFNEYQLATTLLAMQTDVSLSNLLLLQIEFAQGRIPEALTVANELILSSSVAEFHKSPFREAVLIENCYLSLPKVAEFHKSPFREAVLIENCYLSLPKGAVIQYTALIQAHICFLILVRTLSTKPQLRDFALGNIMVMSQVLQRYGQGEVITRLIAAFIKTNNSFIFPNFDQYICQSHVFTSFFNEPKIQWQISEIHKSLEGAIQGRLLTSPPADLDPVTVAKSFIRNNSVLFNEFKTF
uniref:Uncharacterized protein n=1 Tax=Panagrolaimus sp. ES5 TaxID=591445 RepID=A0AC34FTH4_9BILA